MRGQSVDGLRSAGWWLGALISLALLAGCFGESDAVDQRQVDADAGSHDAGDRKAQFEPHTELELPASAEVTFYQRLEGMDALYRAILEVPTDDFYDWAAGFGLSKGHFEQAKRYQLGPDEGRWRPRQEASLPTAQVRLDNAMVLALGVTESDSGGARVYLVYHGT